MDTMGKEKILKIIIKDPNILFDKVSSISYKDDNLLNIEVNTIWKMLIVSQY